MKQLAITYGVYFYVMEACSSFLQNLQWSQSHNVAPPSKPDSSKWKVWDAPVVKAAYGHVLEESHSDHSQLVYLLLHTHPISSPLKMKDNVIQFAAQYLLL